MPYNLFTHITPEEQLDILKEARRFTKKVIVVTIETIDHMVEEAGFIIMIVVLLKKDISSDKYLFVNKRVDLAKSSEVFPFVILREVFSSLYIESMNIFEN